MIVGTMEYKKTCAACEATDKVGLLELGDATG